MTAYLYTTEASKSVDNSKVIILPFAKSSDEEKCSGMWYFLHEIIIKINSSKFYIGKYSISIAFPTMVI